MKRLAVAEFEDKYPELGKDGYHVLKFFELNEKFLGADIQDLIQIREYDGSENMDGKLIYIKFHSLSSVYELRFFKIKGEYFHNLGVSRKDNRNEKWVIGSEGFGDPLRSSMDEYEYTLCVGLGFGIEKM